MELSSILVREKITIDDCLFLKESLLRKPS